MGGCRCTYRNCSVRSDGSTHMFHYPVFDKVRCHKWLTNAQRLDFLNLKVSQLRNRNVCQHHFKDECFMNFMKDKLTFEAVPTEDGPFCQSDQSSEITSLPKVAQVCPVTTEDIENEYLSTTDKKAHYSVKYGDFLTNCEVMDFIDMLQTNNEIKIVDPRNLRNNSSTNVDPKTLKPVQSDVDIVDKESEENLLYMPYSRPVVVGIELGELSLGTRQTPAEKNQIPTQITHTKPNQEKSNTKAKKIKIISEKKISTPIHLKGKLTPISPSITIPHSAKRENMEQANTYEEKPRQNISKVINQQFKDTVLYNSDTQSVIPSENDLKGSLETYEIKFEDNNIVKQTKQVETRFVPSSQKNLQGTHTLSKLRKDIRNTRPNISLIKPKITPERVAAIKEKRKFNMRLRDIIESCLDKIDDNEKITNENVTKQLRREQEKQSVEYFLSKDSNLPSVQEYNIAAIESRLKKMEETLLNKINQNSQKILELKDSIASGNKRKMSEKQITQNEEVVKRNLYHEISKYLSPKANTLIYEELFLDKYLKKIPRASSPNIIRKKRNVTIL